MKWQSGGVSNRQLSPLVALVDVAKWSTPQRRQRVEEDGNLTATRANGAQGHVANFFANGSGTDRIREVSMATFEYSSSLVTRTKFSHVGGRAVPPLLFEISSQGEYLIFLGGAHLHDNNYFFVCHSTTHLHLYIFRIPLM
jgi:hypothetical protein